MRLAEQLASRYVRPGRDAEDLVQVASVALIKAVDRFDPERGHTFASYAAPTILGELRRHFRDTTWAVHIPRGAQEAVLKVARIVDELVGETGEAPTIDEIAQRSGLAAEQVVEALIARQSRDVASLDAPVGPEDGDRMAHGDLIGEEDPGYEHVADRDAAAAALRALNDREQSVVELRFGQDLTQTEIAERLGVSQMQVSRDLRQALARASTIARHHSAAASRT